MQTNINTPIVAKFPYGTRKRIAAAFHKHVGHISAINVGNRKHAGIESLLRTLQVGLDKDDLAEFENFLSKKERLHTQIERITAY